MLCALLDYLSYRRRRGRFARTSASDPMCLGWEERLPDAVASRLADGDILLIETFGSFLSWLVMYFTSSQTSHVAIYCEGGRVSHMTLSRLVIEPIENLYGPNIRILPGKVNWPAKKEPMEQITSKYSDRPYGWYVIMRKAALILSGRHWYYFRWKFFLDISLTLVLFDACLYLLSGVAAMSILIPLYLLVIGINRIRWSRNPLKRTEHTMAPAEAVLFVMNTNGTFLVRPEGYRLMYGPGSPFGPSERGHID